MRYRRRAASRRDGGRRSRAGGYHAGEHLATLGTRANLLGLQKPPPGLPRRPSRGDVWVKAGSTCTIRASCNQPNTCNKGLAFWDGDSTLLNSGNFKLRTALPTGAWCWQTCLVPRIYGACSPDTGLNQSGDITVTAASPATKPPPRVRRHRSRTGPMRRRWMETPPGTRRCTTRRISGYGRVTSPNGPTPSPSLISRRTASPTSSWRRRARRRSNLRQEASSASMHPDARVRAPSYRPAATIGIPRTGRTSTCWSRTPTTRGSSSWSRTSWTR